ncbi:MAG TPA: MBL fold metallo-hydrolase [Acidimicrobiales bacterium]|nr:MBL fold metallo-hydrolase [Acidimicrobiales bacterium]
MQTRVTEIADHTYRLSTFVPDVGPTGFTFNQFLVVDDEPLLFHTGPRGMFPLVREAIASVLPVESLRWITFGHVEADECGAMNLFLGEAPNAQVAHGGLGCMVSLDDMADRMPLPMMDGQVLEIGAHRIRHIDTPHVPHGWEARVLYDETTGTLFAGDLLSNVGDPAPLTTDDIVGVAGEAEDMFGATCLTPNTAPTIRRLAELAPTTIAVMHGSSFAGDGAAALRALADDYEARLTATSMRCA